MESAGNEIRQVLRSVWIALLLVFSGLGLWELQDLHDQIGYELGDNFRQQHHDP